MMQSQASCSPCPGASAANCRMSASQGGNRRPSLFPSRPSSVVERRTCDINGRNIVLENAETAYREAWMVNAATLGVDHPETVLAAMNLATVLHMTGNAAEAESLLKQCANTTERMFGRNDKYHLTACRNLAVCFVEQGRFSEAEAQLRQVLKAQQEILGPEHMDAVATCEDLAGVLTHTGEEAEAEQLLRLVSSIRNSSLGEEHPMSVHAAEALDRMGAEGVTLLNALDPADARLLQ
mmetsp:Transcript_20420/g.45788  ORF Transcript_20420/g.45788 Transcript_20420/m.45788 type:complete len:238 (+) Transcript_20420:14-727(+)